MCIVGSEQSRASSSRCWCNKRDNKRGAGGAKQNGTMKGPAHGLAPKCAQLLHEVEFTGGYILGLAASPGRRVQRNGMSPARRQGRESRGPALLPIE